MFNSSLNLSCRWKHKEKMKSILQTGLNSDIVLEVNGVEFKVHKTLLSLHSPVFEAMFSHADTKEVTEQKVIIEDVSVDAIRTLLYFIYTGDVESKNDLTLDLLIAADKVRFCCFAILY